MTDPTSWRNLSPGDLSRAMAEVQTTDVETSVAAARAAFPEWAGTSLDARISALQACQVAIRENSDRLAHLIAEETGKPLTEARGELGAVIAKFDLTIADAREFLADRPVNDGPHPALVRIKPRGPAAIIAPFNFPIHLGHGAAVAYLLAGNPVLFKPSPLAAATCAVYGSLMAAALPPGVFQIVQGWGDAGRQLSLHPDVRAVCFTGSAAVGRALATELAADYSKSLALELGGKNAAIVCEDADPTLAATGVADALCLTAGQRCNATSRALVHESLLDDFLSALRDSLDRYRPGNPLEESTTLGPLISSAAVDRYRSLTSLDVGKWLVPGTVPESVSGKCGHYVTPAVALCRDFDLLSATPLQREETFSPVLTVIPFRDDDDAVRIHDSTPFGLTASIFSADRSRFETLGSRLQVGNLYWNLPTTFSPSTLPFGGLGMSGNGKPGGRGFVRFAGDEQAVQWREPAAS
jgi:acyl-CoA reductase-like NAD-dependent aldehyde dehydrogenase